MVVHPDENPDTIVHAMAKKWNVLLPKLLLCLVGGDTTTASLPMQRAFSKVLVEALLRTGQSFQVLFLTNITYGKLWQSG